MRNDIRKDYLWNTIGVFAQNAISPLLLIVITRVNGIYDSGLFSFAFSAAIILWALGMWGGRTYQVSDVKGEFSHRSYIMTRLILANFMVIAALVFCVINHYNIDKSEVLLTLVAFKVVESVADSIHGILQVHNRLHLVGKSLLYKATGGFISFLIIDLLTKSIVLGCISIVIVNALLVVFYDVRIAKKLEDIKIRSNKSGYYVKNAIGIIKRCAPVFAVSFLAMFSLNIPRYFIDKYVGNQVGYFGIIAMPITLIVLLMSFILQPNVLSLSRLYERKGWLEFNKIVGRLMLITITMGVAILITTFLIGTQALHLVFGLNFSKYRVALVVIVAGGVANALVSILINILTIMRHIKAQFYILLFTNTVLAVLSALIIKERGLLGGVWLFAIINFVQMVLLSIVYNNTLQKVKL